MSTYVIGGTPFEDNRREVDEFVTLSRQEEWKYKETAENGGEHTELGSFFHERQLSGVVSVAEPDLETDTPGR